MKNDPIVAALAALDDLQPHTEEGRKRIAKALAAKSNLVAAKAARIAGEAQWTEIADDLAASFHRFLKQGSALDKGCAALTAIARALFALDYDDADLYMAGMRHVQLEPVWGGSSDTAAELRGVCAMGLASTSYPERLRELVNLLVDREWQARAGAARAIAATGSEAAALLLRLKALEGDDEPEVLAACFGGLLAIEGAGAVAFIVPFAEAKAPGVREAAILALGESRRADAIAWLIERCDAVANVETRQCILLSLATSRTEAAIAYLLGVIREGSAQASAMAVSAMEINRADQRLRAEIEKALQAR